MKKIFIIFFLGSLTLFSREYPLRTNAYTPAGKLIGEISYAEEDLNHDGRPEKIFSLKSIFDYQQKSLDETGPRETSVPRVFEVHQGLLSLIQGQGTVFLTLNSSERKFIFIFENKKEIRGLDESIHRNQRRWRVAREVQSWC